MGQRARSLYLGVRTSGEVPKIRPPTFWGPVFSYQTARSSPNNQCHIPFSRIFQLFFTYTLIWTIKIWSKLFLNQTIEYIQNSDFKYSNSNSNDSHIVHQTQVKTTIKPHSSTLYDKNLSHFLANSSYISLSRPGKFFFIMCVASIFEPTGEAHRSNNKVVKWYWVSYSCHFVWSGRCM